MQPAYGLCDGTRDRGGVSGETGVLFGKRERRIKRILIVEDEPLVAFDNEHALTAAGYEIAGTLDNVADARRVIAGQPIDLVLADVRLSDGDDGLEVAAAAHARDVPVLFVTGNCPPEAELHGIGCLGKPFNERALLAAIEAIDRTLAGRPPRKLPAGLTLFAKP